MERRAYLADMDKKFFHWCCHGLTTDLLFANTQEFIAGMNRIAVCWLYCNSKGRLVKIIAFCLLNNHFHFVLYGTEEDCASFMEHYRMLSLQWIRNHRKERLHGDIKLGHWPAINAEKVRTKVVYTLRQTLEAGLQITPQGYPWCSARLMFNDNSYLLETAKSVNDYSGRRIQKILNSEMDLPPSWLILSNDMVWPGCYTNIGLAESLFTGVKDFMLCLNNGNIDKAILVEMSPEVPSLPDTEVLNKAETFARKLFGRKRISECSAEERVRIAGFLKKELHCGYKQLARTVRMTEEALKKNI